MQCLQVVPRDIFHPLTITTPLIHPKQYNGPSKAADYLVEDMPENPDMRSGQLRYAGAFERIVQSSLPSSAESQPVPNELTATEARDSLLVLDPDMRTACMGPNPAREIAGQ